MHLLDSDLVIDLLTGRGDIASLHRIMQGGAAISILTYVEVYEGILGGREPKRAEQAFRAFLRNARVITLDRRIALEAARIRVYLRRQHAPVSQRSIDLLIAATAINRGLPLATRNTKHYHDIPGLVLVAM